MDKEEFREVVDQDLDSSIGNSEKRRQHEETKEFQVDTDSLNQVEEEVIDDTVNSHSRSNAN